jgi:hypothetical protein
VLCCAAFPHSQAARGGGAGAGSKAAAPKVEMVLQLKRCTDLGIMMKKLKVAGVGEQGGRGGAYCHGSSCGVCAGGGGAHWVQEQ